MGSNPPFAAFVPFTIKEQTFACPFDILQTASSQRPQTPSWLWVPTSGRTFQQRAHFSPVAKANDTATPAVSGIRKASAGAASPDTVIWLVIVTSSNETLSKAAH